MDNTKNVVEFLFDKIQALLKHCKAAETYPVEMTGQVRHVSLSITN